MKSKPAIVWIYLGQGPKYIYSSRSQPERRQRHAFDHRQQHSTSHSRGRYCLLFITMMSRHVSDFPAIVPRTLGCRVYCRIWDMHGHVGRDMQAPAKATTQNFATRLTPNSSKLTHFILLQCVLGMNAFMMPRNFTPRRYNCESGEKK